MKTYNDTNINNEINLTVTFLNEKVEQLSIRATSNVRFVECEENEADLIVKENGSTFYKKFLTAQYDLIALNGVLCNSLRQPLIDFKG